VRYPDGSAGDADYGRIAAGYTEYRRPDPRISAAILEALGGARTVLNVGAGAGSYEPRDRELTAVEPSGTMRARRPPELPAAVDAAAVALPFEGGSFEASMAIFTVHQWRDLDAGLSELRRVTTGPVVVLTFDPDAANRFWLNEYAPEVISTMTRRDPPIRRLVDALGARSEVHRVPIPRDCTDGFCEAYYGRPEGLLDPGARSACSVWSFVDDGVVARFERELSADLRSGRWDGRHGALRTLPGFDGSLRLVIGRGRPLA
jgi:SAM-dependent methyltransferase